MNKQNEDNDGLLGLGIGIASGLILWPIILYIAEKLAE